MSFNHHFPLHCWFTLPKSSDRQKLLQFSSNSYLHFSVAESCCQPRISCNSVQTSHFWFQLKNAYSLLLCGLPDFAFHLFILYQLPNDFFSVLFPVSPYTTSLLISVAAPLTATLKAKPLWFSFSNHFPFSKGDSVHQCVHFCISS